MRYLIILLASLPLVCHAQLFGSIEFIDTPDTLVEKNGDRYPIIIMNENEVGFSFYRYDDRSKAAKQVKFRDIDKVIRADFERSFIDLKMSDLIGHTIYIEVVPFKLERGKFFHLRVDMGINEYTGLLVIDDKPAAFKSEFSAVNFFISHGWELYSKETLEKGTVGGAGWLGSSRWASMLGGSIKLYTTKYVFSKEL